MLAAVLSALVLSMSASCPSGQDTSIVRSLYGGSWRTVPEGFDWKIERVFMSTGEGYNVQVSGDYFSPIYREGDTLRAPFYIPEQALISEQGMLQFQFYIHQYIHQP